MKAGDTLNLEEGVGHANVLRNVVPQTADAMTGR